MNREDFRGGLQFIKNCLGSKELLKDFQQYKYINDLLHLSLLKKKGNMNKGKNERGEII